MGGRLEGIAVVKRHVRVLARLQRTNAIVHPQDPGGLDGQGLDQGLLAHVVAVEYGILEMSFRGIVLFFDLGIHSGEAGFESATRTCSGQFN